MTALTAAERDAFKRCRRAWDLGAQGRRNLEPMISVDPLTVDRPVRDALAVYYFPGMWDWSRNVVIPLVLQALDKAIARQRDRLGPDVPRAFDLRAGAARQLLESYIEWSPTVERVAPVLVEAEYAADLPDPDGEGSALLTLNDQPVSYRGHLDLLAVDENDAYWIMRHRVVDEWTSVDSLVRDEEELAACWAWGQYYIGMEIAGTIHNEMRLPSRVTTDARTPPSDSATGESRGGLAQHEPSGGGRSIPQHRRLYARTTEPANPERIRRDDGVWFRRTWIRRSPSEINEAARQLASEAKEMFDPGVTIYPSPSESSCRRCAFAAPCLALYEGRDAEAAAILESSYQPRVAGEEVRLGERTWSVGRGAAPPQFTKGRPHG